MNNKIMNLQLLDYQYPTLPKFIQTCLLGGTTQWQVHGVWTANLQECLEFFGRFH